MKFNNGGQYEKATHKQDNGASLDHTIPEH